MTQTEAAKKEAGDAPPQNIKDESPNVRFSNYLEYFWNLTEENRNCPDTTGAFEHDWEALWKECNYWRGSQWDQTD